MASFMTMRAFTSYWTTWRRALCIPCSKRTKNWKLWMLLGRSKKYLRVSFTCMRMESHTGTSSLRMLSCPMALASCVILAGPPSATREGRLTVAPLITPPPKYYREPNTTCPWICGASVCWPMNCSSGKPRSITSKSKRLRREYST